MSVMYIICVWTDFADFGLRKVIHMKRVFKYAFAYDSVRSLWEDPVRLTGGSNPVAMEATRSKHTKASK